MTCSATSHIPGPPPPWIEFPDPSDWTDWVRPTAGTWFIEAWRPYWQSLSILQKMAYERQWHISGSCFYVLLSWTRDSVRRTGRAYVGVTRTVAERRFHRWALKVRGIKDDGLGPEAPFPMLPMDEHALPPPWLCMFDGENNLPWAMRYGLQDGFLDQIWLPFWLTRDDARRRDYLARWPRNTPWEQFLTNAGKVGLFTPYQELNLHADATRRLIWRLVDSACAGDGP